MKKKSSIAQSSSPSSTIGGGGVDVGGGNVGGGASRRKSVTLPHIASSPSPTTPHSTNAAGGGGGIGGADHRSVSPFGGTRSSVGGGGGLWSPGPLSSLYNCSTHNNNPHPSRSPLHPLPLTPSHRLHLSPSPSGGAANNNNTANTTTTTTGGGSELSKLDPASEERLDALFQGYAQDAIALHVLIQAREHLELTRQQQSAHDIHDGNMRDYNQRKKAEEAAKIAAEKLEKAIQFQQQQQQQLKLKAQVNSTDAAGNGKKLSMAAAKKGAAKSKTKGGGGGESPIPVVSSSSPPHGSSFIDINNVDDDGEFGDEKNRSLSHRGVGGVLSARDRHFQSPYPTTNNHTTSSSASHHHQNGGGSRSTPPNRNGNEYQQQSSSSSPMTLIQSMLKSSSLKTSKLATTTLLGGKSQDGGVVVATSSEMPPAPVVPQSLIVAATASQAATVELRRIEQFLLRNRRFPAKNLAEKVERLLALSTVVSTKAQLLYSKLPSDLRSTDFSGGMIGGGVASGHVAALISSLLKMEVSTATTTSSSTAPPSTSPTGKYLHDCIPAGYLNLLHLSAPNTTTNTKTTTTTSISSSSPTKKSQQHHVATASNNNNSSHTLMEQHLDALDSIFKKHQSSSSPHRQNNNNNKSKTPTISMDLSLSHQTNAPEDEEDGNGNSGGSFQDPFALLLPLMGVGSVEDVAQAISLRTKSLLLNFQDPLGVSQELGGGGGGAMMQNDYTPRLTTMLSSDFGGGSSFGGDKMLVKGGGGVGVSSSSPLMDSFAASPILSLSNTTNGPAVTTKKSTNNLTSNRSFAHSVGGGGGGTTMRKAASFAAQQQSNDDSGAKSPKRSNNSTQHLTTFTSRQQGNSHVSLIGEGCTIDGSSGGGSNCMGACQWCYFRKQEDQDALLTTFMQQQQQAPANISSDVVVSSGSKSGSPRVRDGVSSPTSAAAAPLPPAPTPQPAATFSQTFDLGRDGEIARLLALLPASLPPATLQSLQRTTTTGGGIPTNTTTTTTSAPSSSKVPPLVSNASIVSPPPSSVLTFSKSGAALPPHGTSQLNVSEDSSSLPPSVAQTPTHQQQQQLQQPRGVVGNNTAFGGSRVFATVSGVEIDLERLLAAVLHGVKLLNDKSQALTRRLDAAKKARSQQEKDLRLEADALRRELDEIRRSSIMNPSSSPSNFSPSATHNNNNHTSTSSGVHVSILDDPQLLNANNRSVSFGSSHNTSSVVVQPQHHQQQQQLNPLNTSSMLPRNDSSIIGGGGHNQNTTTTTNKAMLGLAQRLEERDQQLKASQHESHSKDKSIRNLRADIAERDGIIAQLEGELRVERSEVTVVKKQVKDVSSIRGEEARMSSSAVKQLEDSLGDKRAQIIALSRTVEVLKSGMGAVGSEWLALEDFQDDSKTLFAALHHEISTIHSVFNPLGLAKEVAELRQTIAMEHHLRDEQESALATLRQENDHLKLRGRILKSNARDIIDRVLASVEWKLLHARAPEESINAQEKLLALLCDADNKDAELISQLLEKARGFQLKVENEVSAREQRRRAEVATKFFEDFKIGEGLPAGVTCAYPTLSISQLASRIASGDATIPARGVDALSAYFNAKLVQNDGYCAVFDRQVEAHLGTGAFTEAGPLPTPDLRSITTATHSQHHLATTTSSSSHNNNNSNTGNNNNGGGGVSIVAPSPCYSVLPVSTSIALGDLTYIPTMVLEGEDQDTDGAAVASRQVPVGNGEFQRAYHTRMRRRRRKQDQVALTFDIGDNTTLGGGGASSANYTNNNTTGRGGGGGGGPVRAVVNSSPAALLRTADYRQSRVNLYLNQLQGLVGQVKGPTATRKAASSPRHRGGGRNDVTGGAASDDEMANTTNLVDQERSQSVVSSNAPSYFLPMSATLAQPLPLEQLSFAQFVINRRQLEAGRQ